MVESNWRQGWIALRFFLIWGFGFGGLLGFISGALIFPLFGAALATPWGIGIGMGLGALVGLITGVITVFAPITPENVRRYRRMLSLTVGALIALAAPLLVHLTSSNILWFPPGYYDWSSDTYSTEVMLTAFWLPSILAAAFWGGLSAAYIAHRFAEHCALNVQVGQDEKTGTRVVDHPNDIPIYWMGKFASQWWLYPVMMGVGGLVNYAMQLGQYEYNLYPGRPEVDFPVAFLSGTVMAIFYTVGATLLMGASNGLLLTFLNRVGFLEYAPGMSEARYRSVTTLVTTGFTLVMGGLMAFGLLGPQPGPLMLYRPAQFALVVALIAAAFGALAAGRIAGRYAPRYFAAREKRKGTGARHDPLLDQPFILGSDGELEPVSELLYARAAGDIARAQHAGEAHD